MLHLTQSLSHSIPSLPPSLNPYHELCITPASYRRPTPPTPIPLLFPIKKKRTPTPPISMHPTQPGPRLHCNGKIMRTRLQGRAKRQPGTYAS